MTVTGLTGGTIADQAGITLTGVLDGLDLGLSVDMLAPGVTITTANGFTNQATQTISGTVTPVSGGAGVAGTAVTLFDNGTQVATATVGAGGNWSAGVTLSAGQNSIVAEDTDTANDVGVSSPLSLTLDEAAPTVTITTASAYTNQADFTVAGTVATPSGAAEAVGTTVTLFDNGVNAGTATVGADGSWTSAIALQSGANSIVAEETDAAGNTGAAAPPPSPTLQRRPR